MGAGSGYPWLATITSPWGVTSYTPSEYTEDLFVSDPAWG